MIRFRIKLNYPLILFFFPSFLLSLGLAGAHKCQRTCAAKHYPYPFGFSSGCQIRLNCTQNGDVFIGEFPVMSFNEDSFFLRIKAQCDRPLLHTIRHLFRNKYAPTYRNAFLLQNCAETLSPCVIPATIVQTHFESTACNSTGGGVDCYSDLGNGTAGNSGFMSLEKLERSGCEYLMSSITAEELFNETAAEDTALSLEVEAIELGWWLEGECECSGNAECKEIESPTNRKRGYRCRCKEGFDGDGFTGGTGCRKVSAECNPAKYISGQCGGTSRIFVLIGGIATGAALMVILGLICCFMRRRCSKLKSTKSTKRRLSEATSCCGIPIYPYREIERATNNFSDKQMLGNGAYGTVYAGKLSNDEWVAIKRIRHRDTGSIEQVMNEIKLLSLVSHPNLVRLLGCSIEYGEQILVYEFMPNGTLCQHLQRERGDGLPWPVRLTIATETAQAIAHLHSAINPPIYHRDIKSSNILLDCSFRSKVADFGLSRLGVIETSLISTAPQGTPGYLDPQYHQDFHLSDKSDVYSFGVVLVEIITALKVVDFSRPQNEVNLASLATDRIAKGCLDEIVDPLLELHQDAWTLSSLNKVAELAFRCLAFHRDMRPSMVEVAAELERIRLSRWITSEGNNCTASSDLSSYSSSNESEKPLRNVVVDGKLLSKLQSRHDIMMESWEKAKDGSPVSMQDPWSSVESLPSSSSLLSNDMS